MLKLKGFPIISYLLQKSTPELLSEETFSSMKSKRIIFFSFLNFSKKKKKELVSKMEPGK